MAVEIQQPQEVGKSRALKVDEEYSCELFTAEASNEDRTIRATGGIDCKLHTRNIQRSRIIFGKLINHYSSTGSK